MKQKNNYDASIQKELREQFGKNGIDDNIAITVSGGTVTLKGEGKNEAERMQAEELASKLPELVKIRNELNVKKDSGIAHAVAVVASKLSELATGKNDTEAGEE